MSSTLDALGLIRAGSAFGLVLTLWSASLLWWRARRASGKDALRRRLTPGLDAEERSSSRTLRLWHEGREATLDVPDLPSAPSPLARLEERCREAGFQAPPRVVLAIVAGLSVVLAATLFVITGHVPPALVGAVTVPVIWSAVLHKRILKRAQVFERQFVDALELSARALRAGHPLLSSFQLIADEIPAPVGRLFSEICQQQTMGLSLDVALRTSAASSRSPDMQLFAAALAIHTRSGGNLADVMQSIAVVIRERLRLQRRFRVLVAQTQISKRILLAMPFVMFASLCAVGPAYVEVLYATPTGMAILAGAGVSLLCGWAVMNRMADLKV